MKKEYLNLMIKKYGSKITLKKGELLFNKKNNDYNIYLIFSGIIALQTNGQLIFELGKGQIIGEKSFFEKKKKGLDAISIGRSVVYSLSIKQFEKLDFDIQKQFLSHLIVFLSDRIYKINTILNHLELINKKILEISSNYDKKKLMSIFSYFIDIDGYLIFKKIDKSYMLLGGDIIYSEDIDLFLNRMEKENNNLKIGKNYIYLLSGNFVYVLYGNPKFDDYVLANTLLYSGTTFSYLGELVENYKNNFVLQHYLD